MLSEKEVLKMSEVKIAVTIAPENEISQTFLNELVKYQTSIDIIELRVDQWATPRVDDVANVIDNLYELNLNKKILVTYRTQSQGGKGDLSFDAYIKLLERIIEIDHVDMIDVEFEINRQSQYIVNLIDQAHKNDVEVILSYHDFQKTPPLAQLKHLYFKMHQMNPDYLKVAVMPYSKEDVLNLLSALSTTVDTVPQQVIGIAMSKLGIISRTAQGIFGGAVSYGCLDNPKAPGQIQVENLRAQLKLYQ